MAEDLRDSGTLTEYEIEVLIGQNKRLRTKGYAKKSGGILLNIGFYLGTPIAISYLPDVDSAAKSFMIFFGNAFAYYISGLNSLVTGISKSGNEDISRARSDIDHYQRALKSFKKE